VHHVGMDFGEQRRLERRGAAARQAVAAVLIGLVVAGCANAGHAGTAASSAPPGSSAATSSATAAKEICAKHFRHTTLAMMTTLRQAFARGTPYPGEIFGSSSYPPDTAAAQCLVPAGSGNYNVEVIVLSDGGVLLDGSQPIGNAFMARP
jgi:hypothetical protein